MTKPTLQEIANLPHTQAVNAMREHYDPQWPMVTHEPDEMTECDCCGEAFERGELKDGYCHLCVDGEYDD